MKKTIMKVLAVAALGVGLVGCGQQVEVAPAEIGKVMTKNGYKEGILNTSKFRLDPCWNYCDKLVKLDVSDKGISESLDVFMPRDKLMMTFDLRATLAMSPAKYDEVFSLVTPVDKGEYYRIPLATVYKTYAKNIIRAEVREYLTQFTIAEVASSREAINAEISEKISRIIEKRTPFRVKYIGLADVKYPPIILEAQENAAERREKIEQENAQLKISEVQLGRKLKEQQLQRKIDVEKAQAEAEVNKIISQSMTPAYKAYRSLQIMEKLANSDNKVFMPTEMLSTVGGQIQLGK